MVKLPCTLVVRLKAGLVKLAVPVAVPVVKVWLVSMAVDIAEAVLPSPAPTPAKGMVAGAGTVLFSLPTGIRLEFFSTVGLTAMVAAEAPPEITSLRWKKLEKAVKVGCWLTLPGVMP